MLHVEEQAGLNREQRKPAGEDPINLQGSLNGLKEPVPGGLPTNILGIDPTRAVKSLV